MEKTAQQIQDEIFKKLGQKTKFFRTFRRNDWFSLNEYVVWEAEV